MKNGVLNWLIHDDGNGGSVHYGGSTLKFVVAVGLQIVYLFTINLLCLCICLFCLCFCRHFLLNSSLAILG